MNIETFGTLLNKQYNNKVRIRLKNANENFYHVDVSGLGYLIFVQTSNENVLMPKFGDNIDDVYSNALYVLKDPETSKVIKYIENLLKLEKI